MTYSPFTYLRRCAKAQKSLIYHISGMIAARRKEIAAQQLVAGSGEKVPAQSDILGALVTSQMAVEAEIKSDLGSKSAGLTPEEVLGNVCESQ